MEISVGVEEAQEQRYICKICSKSCVSGKSLGGHMRVHLAQISALKKAAETKVATEMDSETGFEQNGVFQLEKPSNNQSNSTVLSVEDIKNCHSNTDYEESDPSNSYELRENRKKSWKFSKPKYGISRNVICKVCYKRFPSLRALSGHMRFHSMKSKGLHQCTKCGKAFDSMRAVFGHMKSHSKKSSRARDESAENSLDLGKLCPVRKKRSSVRYKIETNLLVSSLNASSSTVFEFEEEQDAAVCLMMLSTGVTGSSCHDSVYFGTGSSSKSRQINGHHRRFVCEGDKISSSLTSEKDCCIYGSGSIFSRNVSEFDDHESIRTPKMLEGSSVSTKLAGSDKDPIMEPSFQETDSELLKSMFCKKARLPVHDLAKNSPQNGTSNLELTKNPGKKLENRQKKLDKNFKSHQAVGSHRMRHKLSSNISSVVTNTGKLSVHEDRIKHNDDDQLEFNSIRLGQGTKDYQCSTCFKLFGSGTLVGHKRAHYAVLGESKNKEITAGNQQFVNVDNFLDLNFPLTADESTNGHVELNLWRVERCHEHELVLKN